MVGTSGSAALRLPLVTASARTAPDRMCASEDGTLSISMSSLPPITSISAGEEPR
jgi:hypothetical protein